MQLGGAWANATVLGELPSAAGHGVAPVSGAAGAIVLGNGVVVVVGAFGSTVVVANSVVVVTSVAEPLPPRLINHTIPEIATATMGMRMMYMPVRLRLSLRAWRANSSRRC